LSMEFAEFHQAEELSEQRELFDDAFPEHKGLSAASIDHYRWKFHQAPVTPHSYEYAAKDGGRMLGYYAAIPYRYQVGDRRLLVGMVCDVMTHSRARGRGVFTELGRFALSEMASTDLGFLTGYPVRPEVMGGHLRVGWRVAFDLPMYLRPLRANAILKSRGVGWLSPPANAGIFAYRALGRLRPASAYEVCAGAPESLFHSSRFAEFVEIWSEGVRNHLVKSADFYDWRLGAPGTSYRAFLVSRGETVVAAAVGRVANLQGIPSFALLDLMVLRDEQDALAALYHEIDREARARDVEAIVTIMSRSRAREHRLRRHGFLTSPFTFKLILHPLNGAIPFAEIAAERDWHLMWIDSDDL
jgi:hypothetical protein